MLARRGFVGGIGSIFTCLGAGRSDPAEDARRAEDRAIADRVRRRYVARVKYLGDHRGKNDVYLYDAEFDILEELLGVQGALGGPNGCFP